MKEFSVNELFDLSKTLAAPLFEGIEYTWQALPIIKDFILKLGETLSPVEYDKRGDDIWVLK